MRLLVLFVALATLATPARAADRNVVFFVADDHGTEALGAYGNRVVKTPSLDQLASEGVRFTHAFATTASCSASRSVLLTGVHNHRNGQYGHEHEYPRRTRSGRRSSSMISSAIPSSPSISRPIRNMRRSWRT